MEFVVDITVDELSGKLYTVSRPNSVFDKETWVCEWTADAQLSACNKTDVSYGYSIEFYSESIFVLQSHSYSSSYRKVVELIYNANETDIESRLLLNNSFSYASLGLISYDFDINPANGDIWIVGYGLSSKVIRLNSADDYEQHHLISETGVCYSKSIQIDGGFAYISSYAASYWSNSGGIKKISLENLSIEDSKILFGQVY